MKIKMSKTDSEDIFTGIVIGVIIVVAILLIISIF